MSLQAEFEMSRRYFEGGSACRGVDCPGLFVSDLDTVHYCPCGESRSFHPEADRPDISPRLPLFVVLVGSIMVGYSNVYRNALHRARTVATEHGTTTQVVRVTSVDRFEALQTEALCIDAATAAEIVKVESMTEAELEAQEEAAAEARYENWAEDRALRMAHNWEGPCNW